MNVFDGVIEELRNNVSGGDEGMFKNSLNGRFDFLQSSF